MGFILLNKIWFECKCLSAKRFYNFIFCTHDSLFCHQLNAIFVDVVCSRQVLSHRKKALVFSIFVSFIRFSCVLWLKGYFFIFRFALSQKTSQKIQSVTHKFTDAYKFHSTAVTKPDLIHHRIESNFRMFFFSSDFHKCLHKHYAKTEILFQHLFHSINSA